jgi:hypothetical protein
MSTLHRRVAVAALLLIVPTVAACGFNEQTDQVYQAGVGVNYRNGQVYVLNALIVDGGNGNGTFGGTLVNQSAGKSSQLISISDSVGPVDVKIAPDAAVNLASSGAVRLKSTAIKPGRFVTLRMEFSNGQVTTARVPVVDHSGDYAAVPVGAPSPTATPSGKAGKKGTAATSSASPTGAPTPTTTPTPAG